MSLMANPVMAQQAGADKSPAKFKGPLKVFILAGQSNMEGQGSVDHEGDHKDGKGNLVWSMANSKSADKLKKLKNEKGEWVVRDDVRIFALSRAWTSLVRQCGELLSDRRSSRRGYEEPVEVIVLH